MVSSTIRSGKGKSRAVLEEKVTAAMPLGKQLAHTDKKVRDRAIQGLVAFVSRGSVSEDAEGEIQAEGSSGYVQLDVLEMDKLWKGLFYCFWMSDKPLIQQALATDLAELILQINPVGGDASRSAEERGLEKFQAALGFLDGFWRAIVREWTGVDRYRVDKYYMLMRRYVNATFRLLAREGWREEAVRGVNEVLGRKGGPLTWEDRSVPISIASHLSDIYLEELDKVLGLPEVNSQPACPLIHLLQPFTTLLARTRTPQQYTRLLSTLFQPLLNSLSQASPSITSEPPNKRTKTDAPAFAHIVMGCCLGDSGVEERVKPEVLRKGLLKGLFVEGSDEKAWETGRRKIYALWREEGGDDDGDDED